MIYVGALLLMVLTSLMLESMTVKKTDEKHIQICKLIGLFCVIVFQVWIIGHGLTHIIGR